jgi:phosphate transport system permease protein
MAQNIEAPSLIKQALSHQSGLDNVLTNLFTMKQQAPFNNGQSDAKVSDWNNLAKRPRIHENAIQFFLLACGILSIFTTIGILYVLLQESLSFFSRTLLEDGHQTIWASLQEFFTHTVWQPAIGNFGILPLLYGTLATSFIAMLVALPLGLGAAIYLSEFASSKTRNIIKPILEILAGIPTVVYGYFALTFVTPLLQGILGHDTVSIYNSTSAGIVVGILIIPLMSSMSEDALSAVPDALRQASYGLGATKLETITKVVVPAALSGILAAFIISISRAIGETMVVAIAAGAGPQNNIPELLGTRGAGILLEPAETMTGHIARISGGDLSYNSIDYNSIFAIGLMLFVMTFILNIINNAIIKRFREAY